MLYTDDDDDEKLACSAVNTTIILLPLLLLLLQLCLLSFKVIYECLIQGIYFFFFSNFVPFRKHVIFNEISFN